MEFTKKQKEILKKAYNKLFWSKSLYNRIVNEDIDTLRKRLDKLGYTLSIKIEPD